MENPGLMATALGVALFAAGVVLAIVDKSKFLAIALISLAIILFISALFLIP